MTIVNFTPAAALAGGLLIGVAAVWLLLVNGKIAGVSGIFNGVLMPVKGDLAWRAAFVIGLLMAGVVYQSATGGLAAPRSGVSFGLVALAGLLVGWGTRLGSGCTSGHGVCGLGRLSVRSLAAVLTFLLTGMVTVFVVRHTLGGVL